jgi:hypothetical protein
MRKCSIIVAAWDPAVAMTFWGALGAGALPLRSGEERSRAGPGCVWRAIRHQLSFVVITPDPDGSGAVSARVCSRPAATAFIVTPLKPVYRRKDSWAAAREDRSSVRSTIWHPTGPPSWPNERRNKLAVSPWFVTLGDDGWQVPAHHTNPNPVLHSLAA